MAVAALELRRQLIESDYQAVVAVHTRQLSASFKGGNRKRPHECDWVASVGRGLTGGPKGGSCSGKADLGYLAGMLVELPRSWFGWLDETELLWHDDIMLIGV
jgi:hypothetical protein